MGILSEASFVIQVLLLEFMGLLSFVDEVVVHPCRKILLVAVHLMMSYYMVVVIPLAAHLLIGLA
uniref:Predicted protein n=1 Tax=Hordeum vulgare subsp. vulgare TaxID=112509 RepID=F2DJ78_HORVV|nr:predicted protein [Hordeum vulgare subsp. vulgare]